MRYFYALLFACLFLHLHAKTMSIDSNFERKIYTDVDTVIVNCDIEEFKHHIIECFPNVRFYGCGGNAPYISDNGILMNKSRTCIYLSPSNYPYKNGKYKCNRGIKNISKFAFQQSETLCRIDLNNVNIIDDGAFAMCKKLNEVRFRKSLNKIGRSAFAKCSGLKSVYITNVDSLMCAAFVDCVELEELFIPSSHLVDTFCFLRCTGITKAVLPCCQYDAMTFGFSSPKLQHLFFEGIPSYKNRTYFIVDSIPSNAVLYVKKGTIEKFRKMTYFSQFSEIREYESISKSAFRRIKAGKPAELVAFEED